MLIHKEKKIMPNIHYTMLKKKLEFQSLKGRWLF